jgi:phytoene dehydrogenase-like protein
MTSSKKFDAIIIGSGINSLVAGAVLSKSGWQVLVCERNASAGGAIKTEQATLPGYTHELLSSWHPLTQKSLAQSLLESGMVNLGHK